MGGVVPQKSILKLKYHPGQKYTQEKQHLKLVIRNLLKISLREEVK